MDPNIPRILSFWFPPTTSQQDAPNFKRWFEPNATLDQQIASDFGPLVHQARSTPELDSWTQNPQGTLALLLLLDQFPRNIFRGSPDSFASDAKALDVSVRGIAKGFDRKVVGMQQAFFYLPLVHDEDLRSQVAAVILYEGWLGRCEVGSREWEFAVSSRGFAERHRDVVGRFGRFPSRNDVLGRETTEREREYLREHPGGF